MKVDVLGVLVTGVTVKFFVLVKPAAKLPVRSGRISRNQPRWTPTLVVGGAVVASDVRRS